MNPADETYHPGSQQEPWSHYLIQSMYPIEYIVAIAKQVFPNEDFSHQTEYGYPTNEYHSQLLKHKLCWMNH